MLWALQNVDGSQQTSESHLMLPHAAAWRNLGIDNSITNMIASDSESAIESCGISA